MTNTIGSVFVMTTKPVKLECGADKIMEFGQFVFVPVIVLVTCKTTSVDPLQTLHKNSHFQLRSVQVQKHK